VMAAVSGELKYLTAPKCTRQKKKVKENFNMAYRERDALKSSNIHFRTIYFDLLLKMLQ
jgi:hypothetical protein